MKASLIHIETRYGRLGPLDHVETGPQGHVTSAVPAGPVRLETPLGSLTAQFSTDDMRRPKVEPLEFHPNGALKTLALEERTPVATPLGVIEAELVTFHPDGSLRRVFPLNGKLSGYWSEKEEASLAAPLTLSTPAGEITARIVNVQFHPDGTLKSLTLWPGDAVEADTPLGRKLVRVGMSFHPSGAMRSFEPERMESVPTPLGWLDAFDPDPLGIHGDLNSVVFHPDGSTAGLATPLNTVEVVQPGGTVRLFAPGKVPNLCDERVMNVLPLWICFHPGIVAFGREHPERFPLLGHQFKVGRFVQDLFAPVAYPCGA